LYFSCFDVGRYPIIPFEQPDGKIFLCFNLVKYKLLTSALIDINEQKFEKAGSFSFTENELKEIVTNSVQNALEKSIAASLVELAVSELKTQVIRMDQSRAL
jgi:hypothetical protein